MTWRETPFEKHHSNTVGGMGDYLNQNQKQRNRVALENGASYHITPAVLISYFADFPI